MIDTTKTKALQLLGWYREGSFPALFTDSVSVVKQWMEQGHKVSGVIRHDGLAVEAAPGPSTTATPQERDWKAIDAAIDEYVDGYELRLDEGCHTPTEFERFLLNDAIDGLFAEREFLALLTPAPAASDAPTLPALNADLIEILGRPSFTCAFLAQVLRNGGRIIKNKAEHEQAAVIHFVLCQYLAHGPKWREAATSAFQAIAAQQGKGGEA